MEEALELARAKDTKERMAGVERLHHLLESSRKSLTAAETTALVDCCMDLFKDNNFRVSQGALQALASAAVLSGEHLKLHLNAVVPAVVERLGDGKQPVRDAARRLLLTLMEVSSPTIIVERAGSYARAHRSWRVREEFARTVTSAISLFASTELPLQRAILPPVLQMLNDSNPGVREAAILCIEEMYSQVGHQFREELHRHSLPSSTMKDINARLEKIVPQSQSTDGLASNFTLGEIKPVTVNPKRSSPRGKSASREASLFGAEGDMTEKPVEPIQVYSEKELIREFEKIALTLVPEKDWSIRIAAMQRVEGLVYGGATDYPCFKGLLKQLVVPLSTQLSDRRSSIVKQACHLLCFLSKELLGDFESCAEMFIPVLFKLVVITVLVIAESADNCIKTMLRNCKVARIIPRITDIAKHDRSAVLRSRCCEYALLILEYWADAPEIQRSAELYEDMIKCCVADAISEVRSTARMCYRMFSKTWPERSRRLFSSFDVGIQRIVNEEDGGMHRRHASPSVRDRGAQTSYNAHASAHTSLPGYGTSAIVAMDRTASLQSTASLPSGLFLSQTKSLSKGSERSLESVLNASKEKVTAIESMLRGLDVSEKQKSSSLDLGVDPPSSRDPPFPASVAASNHLSSSFPGDIMGTTTTKGSSHSSGLALSDIMSQIHTSKDSVKSSFRSGVSSDSLAVTSYSAKRSSAKLQERFPVEESREARRLTSWKMDRHHIETPYRDGNFRVVQGSNVPNFQRPLLRKNVGGRMSANRRSFDDNQLSLGEMSHYVEGPSSLSDALGEGLSPSSDWSARVAAFTYLRTLLQQGPKGIQEVVQHFEKVMKLFFQHLDDPHHKVAQAALSTLAELIPTCRKPFESYMERILPHVFSRLIDPKELVRQPCTATLDIVGKTYSVDSLLPALLRSLDEQRSPKAKLAVIEFAISSLQKNIPNPEGSGNSGILKLWLAKLTPLTHDKNTKLKEASITCIISVYSYYDPMAVLNFIFSLSVEEQNNLRRALKQYTPRIEVDLMNFLQNKKDRQRSKSVYDPSDVVDTSSEEGYIGNLKQHALFGRYSAGSVDGDNVKKWSSASDGIIPSVTATSREIRDSLYADFITSKSRDFDMVGRSSQSVDSETGKGDKMDNSLNLEGLTTTNLQINGPINAGQLASEAFRSNGEVREVASNNHDVAVRKINLSECEPSIPQILHLIGNDSSDTASSSKRDGLQQLVEISVTNDVTVWAKFFNQILTIVVEVLDCADPVIRELALSLIIEMLKNQKTMMEDSVEIVIEKLLHVTKDSVPKVSNDAEHCLSVVLSQYDPFRCLSVIVPLLVAEDEKTLVVCINCLTKVVGRLSQDELTTQLPLFLPALFEAFGNQSADVRKTVVFCLVDIYIMLGKAFLPYLEGLNATQLKLVTIYANRISQARSGTTIDGSNR
ncbi:hypothetical protein MLD38_032947 [Melastoma candidum]|uniref:Uncharacterized protein n=2 Tax=Melastoma candidum TaxID=119954 RepID=A0ACB9M9J5_9MYRT|nr:hypothetical protein MLD38_032947 [Melastoma candidum]